MNICSEKKRNLKTFAVQKIKKVIHICRATQKWKKWTTFAVQKVKTNWKKHLQCKENKELRKKLHFWGIKALEKHQSEKKRWCFTTLWKNLQERSVQILALEINLNYKLWITLENITTFFILIHSFLDFNDFCLSENAKNEKHFQCKTTISEA